MKNITLMIFLLFSPICTAQSVIIKQDKKQNLIKSISLSFSLIGEDCASYIVTTNNGRIERYNSGCKFLIYPENISETKITIRKIISEESFSVKDIEFFIDINLEKKHQKS